MSVGIIYEDYILVREFQVEKITYIITDMLKSVKKVKKVFFVQCIVTGYIVVNYKVGCVRLVPAKIFSSELKTGIKVL